MSNESQARLKNNYVAQGWGYNIAVSCCSLDATSGARPDCNIGRTVIGGGATFDEAAAICSNAGYRLCTRTEIEDDLTAGLGCSYDGFYNWVNTSCEPAYHVIQDGSSASTFLEEDCQLETSGQAITVNQDGQYDIYTPCCALDGSYGNRTNCTGGLDFFQAYDLCDDAGLRLCTQAELEADFTAGNGCSMDGRYVWTSDYCYPTNAPTSDPTNDPTRDPTADPTKDPTKDPTTEPTGSPTRDPTADPTSDPTSDPTRDPTADPTMEPTTNPTSDPTGDPTSSPTLEPTTPTMDPTADPRRDATQAWGGWKTTERVVVSAVVILVLINCVAGYCIWRRKNLKDSVTMENVYVLMAAGGAGTEQNVVET